MRKRFFFQSVLALAILVSGCKKSSPTTDPAQSLCGAISTFTVAQQQDGLKYNISPVNGAINYETSILTSRFATTNPDDGVILILDSAKAFKYLLDTYIFEPGEHLTIYVRSVCSAGKGNWSQASGLTIADYCERPRNLSMANNGFAMSFFWELRNTLSTASNYQVQYGTHGFSLGAGTIATVNSSPFETARLTAGQNYDFYVRTGCGAGWSSWVGPFTYLSTVSQNNCQQPSGVQYRIERNSSGQAVGANFTWAYNGENSFEYTGVLDGQPVTSGTVYTIGTAGTPTLLVTRNTNYNFYVRAVCSGGNRTSWTGPLLFNIGN